MCVLYVLLGTKHNKTTTVSQSKAICCSLLLKGDVLVQTLRSCFGPVWVGVRHGEGVRQTDNDRYEALRDTKCKGEDKKQLK